MGQPASTSTATEVLGGRVERVTFHNEENGFCGLRVKARGQRDLITVRGHAAVISAGEFVQASGAWQNDRTHGVQFRASFLKAMPPTTEGIEKYLGSGMIRPPARAGPIRSELPTRCVNGSSPSGRHRPPSRRQLSPIRLPVKPTASFCFVPILPGVRHQVSSSSLPGGRSPSATASRS